MAPTTPPTVASSSRAGITTLTRAPWLAFQRSSRSSGQSSQCDVRRRNQDSAWSSMAPNRPLLISFERTGLSPQVPWLTEGP